MLVPQISSFSPGGLSPVFNTGYIFVVQKWFPFQTHLVPLETRLRNGVVEWVGMKCLILLTTLKAVCFPFLGFNHKIVKWFVFVLFYTFWKDLKQKYLPPFSLCVSKHSADCVRCSEMNNLVCTLVHSASCHPCRAWLVWEREGNSLVNGGRKMVRNELRSSRQRGLLRCLCARVIGNPAAWWPVGGAELPARFTTGLHMPYVFLMVEL